MQYMIPKFGKRIYILAADYNFGQLSAAWTKAAAPSLAARSSARSSSPSVSDFTATIARVQKVEARLADDVYHWSEPFKLLSPGQCR